jgi:hypothetical protein
MSWRESAIKIVLEHEFCGLWESLSGYVEGGNRREARTRQARINARTIELERLSDDALFEEARDAARGRGYDQGIYDESYSNSMAESY